MSAEPEMDRSREAGEQSNAAITGGGVGGPSPGEHGVFAATDGSATTAERTRTAEQEARWVDAWYRAYRWRADHWGAMPEEKRRRMMKAREREDIAWSRERQAVARSKSPSTQAQRQDDEPETR
jgi:hypothetical protein